MLKFQPKRKSVVWCNFIGYIEPEIVKNRPIIVIKRHPKNSKLVYVVPISNSIPEPVEYFHHKLSTEFSQKYFNEKEHWVKIDLFNTVTIDRLDRIQDKEIKYQFSIPELGTGEFEIILEKLNKFLNLQKQQNSLARVNET
jgi:uncharacterized protein YifN (PemK superfamily)